MTGESGVKRVLGIVCSQRKLGNCELFIKETARHVPGGCDLSLVRLPAIDIRPCKGCYRCLDEGICPIEDDVPFLKRLIAEADALIIASPVYFLGEYGSVKMLLDRAFSFFSIMEHTRGKPAILAATYGLQDRIGTAPQHLLTLAAFLGLSVKGAVTLKAALPGDVLLGGHLQTAERLGRGLFAPAAPERSRRACPFCGNDVVRVREKDFICTVCHGSFDIAEKGAVKGTPGWDVSNVKFIEDHRVWLKGMKERFLAARKEIVKLTQPYKEMGRWVEPEGGSKE